MYCGFILEFNLLFFLVFYILNGDILNFKLGCFFFNVLFKFFIIFVIWFFLKFFRVSDLFVFCLKLDVLLLLLFKFVYG